MLQWSREMLAKKAGISDRTLIDFERGARKPLKNNLKAIREALESAGITITEKGCVCPPAKD
jgi:transcriptional regulator with XRE-family HTH domain